MALLMLAGVLLQVRRDRQNRHRIACFQAWETRLSDFLFRKDGPRGGFGPIPVRDRWLFRTFLARYQGTLAGPEAEALRELYLGLGIHASLPRRLSSRHARTRALAAQEVALFRLGEAPQPAGLLDRVRPLLDDSVPYVAHAAARALTGSGDLRHAPAVLAWVLREGQYQRDRLLRVLEGFGPDLLPWMEANLEAPERQPGAWVLFALLAGSQRHRDSQPRLLRLLQAPQVDLCASALKALAALADPAIYPAVLPLAAHPAWEIRAQAARALGVLGGPGAVPDLLRLTADRVYEVRRNAAQSLVDLGHAGISALTWLAADGGADRFARDIARERLEWADERGHL